MKSPENAHPPEYYQQRVKEDGAAGYVEWIDHYLDVQLTQPQIEIIEAIHNNQRTLVVAANGFGKTFCLVCFSMAFLFIHYPSVVLATSGGYQKLQRTYGKPMETLHKQTDGALPGRFLHNPPRITIDEEPNVYLECASPADPGELEGVHSKHTLGVVEEADKEAVTEEMFDSLGSIITDQNDKLVAIANPPKDEANIVYDLMQDPTWTVKQFSSFDSHNVLVETGEIDGEIIPEIVTLDQIKQDWEAWNIEPWPGIDKARNSHERDDLDFRWYRRRLGVLAPASSEATRPFTTSVIEEAYDRSPETVSVTPQGLGLDVARETDYNAMVGVFGNEIRVLDYWRGVDHNQNEENVRSQIQNGWHCPFAIDAVGSGDMLADRVDTFYPNRVRFNAGSNANDPRTYANRWTEGLVMLGNFLEDGGTFSDTKLREELLTAARVVELDEKYVNKHDTERFVATKKDVVKDRLGRSPDLLDGAMMAVLMATTGDSGRKRISSTW